MISKAKQLQKNRKPNPKKMTKIEKRLYIDFQRDLSGGICQIPGCNNNAQDWEHPLRGINRDDRYTIMICRSCHTIADQPGTTQIAESIRIKNLGKKIAEENWKEYTL